MQLDLTRRLHFCIVLAACIPTVAWAQTKPAGTLPAQPLPPGWEQIDQRLVFLTIQLSTVESSIGAINKSLVAKGYQKQIQENAAAAARAKNQRMDAMGGGPVPWQDFYGKTAQAFFYHPTDNNTIHINPDPVAQRPPQFDYIYRANLENQANADVEAAKIGDKIDDLLAYRKELETEQSALWCKIVFRGVVSQGYADGPLYHFTLTAPDGPAGKQSADAAGAAVAFLKSIDAELALAQKNMDNQEEEAGHLLAITSSGRTQMQEKLLSLSDYAAASADPKSPLGKFCLLAKRAEDSAQNLVDAYKLAQQGDAKDDLAAKARYRAQIQQSAIDYAETIMTAHQTLGTLVSAWKVTPQVKAPEITAAKPTDVDLISARVDAAKSAYAAEITAARRNLAKVVDQRLNDAADAGELDKVQQLQSAKIKAAADGTLDDSITDESIRTAKKTMEDSITASRAKLALAYQSAISDLTKARMFTEAAAVQEEFKASGFNSMPGAASTGDQGGSSVASSAGTASTVVEDAGFGVREPTFSGETITIRLAGPAENVVLGAGGRLQLLHIKRLRKLAVFDVNKAQVLKYIDLPDDNILYAADRDTLLIATRESGEIQAWNLKTLTKDRTSRGLGPEVKSMTMGYDSIGPLFLSVQNDTLIVDPRTLSNGTPIKWDGTWGGAAGSLAASADGHTLCSWDFPGWAGRHCIVLRGNEIVGRYSGGYMHYNELILPHDGSAIYDTMEGGKTYPTDYKSQIGWEGLPGYAFPSDAPAYFVAFNENADRKASDKVKLVIGDVADRKALVTLSNLPELMGTVPVKHYQRVTYYPNANLLVTLGDGGESLTLRKVDLYKTLADKDIDYLVVTSSPPSIITLGGQLNYQMSVKSRKGSVKYSVTSGPAGMTVSSSGMVHWSVPRTLKDDAVSVIISVTDASQEQVFQSFSLSPDKTR